MVFVGAFNAGRLNVAIEDGKLRIIEEGSSRKFIDHVEHCTFSGPYATMRGQPVLYVTERCVFSLTTEGIELIEVAPGVDLERDILMQMDFKPIIKHAPRLMDARIFDPNRWTEDTLGALLEQRLSRSAAKFVLYQLAGLSVMTKTIDAIRAQAERRPPLLANAFCRQLRPLHNPAGCNGCYSDMVKNVVDRFYSGVTRYTTSSFLRMYLAIHSNVGMWLPHIYEVR